MLSDSNISAFTYSAENTPDGQIASNAIRSLVLYPMNALVSDQLTRIRDMVGNKNLSEHLKKRD